MEAKTDSLLACNEVASWDTPKPPVKSPPEEAFGLVWSLCDVGGLENMLACEWESMPQLSYITSIQRRFITAQTRKEVVEWYWEFREAYSLDALTVSLAVNYFDRFHSNYTMTEESSQMSLPLEKVAWHKKVRGQELLALTCLGLAIKMEEVNPPSMRGLQVSMTDLLDCEMVVLRTLDYETVAVVPYVYLAQCIQVLQVPRKRWDYVLASCMEFLFHSQRDERMQEFRQSTTAIAIVCCALQNTDLGDDKFNWKQHVPALAKSFACSMSDIKECYEVLDLAAFGPVEPPQSPKRDSRELGSQNVESACSCASACCSCCTSISPASVLEFHHSCEKQKRGCETPEPPKQAKKARHS